MVRYMFTIVAALAIAVLAGFAASAQGQSTPQRATVQQLPADTRLSADFQEAMNSGNFARAAVLARDGRAVRAPRSTPSGPSSVAAAGSRPADHVCNSGNCACAGAHDCVQMMGECVEGTVGCNDYGCTCKQKP